MRIAPQFAQAREHLGLALLALGRQDEALTSLRRAAELAPDNVRILLNLVQVYNQLGMLEESRACSEKVRRLRPELP